MTNYDRALNAAMKASTTSRPLREHGTEVFYDTIQNHDEDAALDAALNVTSEDGEAYMKGFDAFWAVRNRQSGSLRGRAGSFFTTLKSKIGLHGPTVLH